MSKKKGRPIVIQQGAPAYMSTYGDLVTNMLCFFVLLFAFSNTDEAKFNQIAASMAGAPISIFDSTSNSIFDMVGNGIMEMPDVSTSSETEEEDELEERRELNQELAELTAEFKTYMAPEIAQEKIEITFDAQESTIKLTFKDGMMFDVGKADIKPDVLRYLDEIANQLINHYPDYDVKIEGHTDSSPISTPQFKNNWYLSGYRAIAVAEYFMNQSGINPNRVEFAGYGEMRPIATNDTAEGRAANRRVEVIIVGRSSQ